jgi:hypothetical protein
VEDCGAGGWSHRARQDGVHLVHTRARHQLVNPSDHQLINPSDHQLINPPDHQLINTPDHQLINPSVISWSIQQIIN